MTNSNIAAPVRASDSSPAPGVEQWQVDATASPSLWATLAETWRDIVAGRHLLYQLTVRDIKVRYKQAVMGFGWAIFLPIMIVLAGIVVRFAMSYLSGDVLDSTTIAGLAIKAIPWAFFVGSIQFASGALVGNMSLVTKIYFPREVLPLSSVLAQTFDSGIGALAVVLTLPFLGVAYGINALWAVPLLAVLFLTTVALSLLLSAANLFFRDVKYLVRVLLTFGIFFTPVFFEPQMFGPLGAQVMMLNPVAPVLEGLRLAVVEGHNLAEPLIIDSGGGTVLGWSPWYLLYISLIAVLGTGMATVLFHRLEFLFAEYI